MYTRWTTIPSSATTTNVRPMSPFV
jgi:hypothetical protein